MFEALPFGFSTPAVLLAMAALPALWLLLRVTPPQPQRIDFPPLKLILDLIPRQETPARTPWWLLLLRLIVAGLVILAMAGPVWNPAKDTAAGKGALVIIVDNGWAAAPDWQQRITAAEDLVRGAARAGRPVAIVAPGESAPEVQMADAGDRPRTASCLAAGASLGGPHGHARAAAAFPGARKGRGDHLDQRRRGRRGHRRLRACAQERDRRQSADHYRGSGGAAAGACGRR